jgi:outer membrane lipase/esterase
MKNRAPPGGDIRMKRFANTLLASAIGLALGAGPAAAQWSNLYFFGDSLTDAGSYAPALPAGLGRFTTNPDPVWAQVLGSRYGFDITPANQGGTDYAQGGARLTATPGFPNQPPTANAVPIATQVQQYIQAGVNRDALHALWGGANDIFVQLGLVQAGQITAAQAQANVVAVAQQYVAQVAALQAAGAGTIVVFNLPDIGKSPAGQAGGPAAAAQISAITSLYNNTVQAGLNAIGGNVVRLDATALLNEVLANPGAYGFTNTTGVACTTASALICGPDQRVAPDANQTYVFADGVHPTGGAHVLVASAVASLLEGPGQAATLAESPLAVDGAAFRAVDARMWSSSNLPPTSQRKLNVWAGIDYANPDIGIGAVSGDADLTTLSIGLDFLVTPELVAGVAANFSEYRARYTGGRHKLEEASGTVYMGYGHGPWYLGGMLLVGTLDYDNVSRSFDYGPAQRSESGTANGTHWSLRAIGGYWMRSGDFNHGPFASLVYQDVEVDNFSERGGTFTALSYGEQTRKSLVGSLGWQVQGQWGMVRPFARAVWEYEFEDDNRSVSASPIGIGGSYEIAVGKPDSNWGLFTFGAAMDFGSGSATMGPLTGYLMGSATAGKSDNDSWSITLGLRVPL